MERDQAGTDMTMRVGMGIDVHALIEGNSLILGGVNIPHPVGLSGHSDGDALTHAVVDALLGAAGMGDIGGRFPSSDDAYKDADSLTFLSAIVPELTEAGWSVQNVDATIVAQRPALSPFVNEMGANIARALGLEPSQINVKATTSDHLGLAGREEGIAAFAVALLEEKTPDSP